MKILDLTLPTPAENLACDEALLDAAESGGSGEVLRFWESPEYFVVVGYANKVATEVNVPACEKKSIPILRRCSGGGTVVQGPGCLSYGLILRIREDGPTRNISAANQFIMERNRGALESLLGQRVETCGHTDLAIAGVKFSGNSQRRRRQFLLFHGTFLLDSDLRLMEELLRLPTQQPDYRQNRSHGEFVRNLHVPADAVKQSLSKTWEVSDSGFTLPREQIASLVEQNYSQPGWNKKF